MKIKITLTLGMLLAGPLFSFSTLAAEPSKPAASNPHDPMMAELMDEKGAAFEASFLAMMVEHHQRAVVMGKLADSRAENPELKKMAGSMVSSQGAEIIQMKEWLKKWHASSPQMYKAKGDAEKMMAESMSKLEAAKGSEFDRLFAMEMAAHHQSAIDMAGMALNRAEHPEVKELAGKIIKTQTEERKMLMKWAGQ